MAMRDPYAGLAAVYDWMARDPGIRRYYEEWRRALLEAAAERGVRGRVLVDLACGTGNSTVPWARRRGWTVIGVDRSAAMLREARRKSRRVRWIRQDIRRLDIGGLGGRADVVTCHFDALNHVLDERDLQRVFTRVARVLRSGGLFQFDLNTVHWLCWLNGREKLFRAGPHVFMASNEFDERTGIATFRQLWFVRRGRLYQRRLVTVRERAFRDSDIRAMLRRAGLPLVKVSTQVRVDGKPGRKLYLAARGGGR
jgi:ubiquinone/menaquinone biosynthesis C-methylase UbiE